MKTEKKHTPGPWRCEVRPDAMMVKIFGPKHPDGSDYAPLFETSDGANASLIVSAVNSHDAAVELAWAISDYLKNPDKVIKLLKIADLNSRFLALAGEKE